MGPEGDTSTHQRRFVQSSFAQVNFQIGDLVKIRKLDQNEAGSKSFLSSTLDVISLS